MDSVDDPASQTAPWYTVPENNVMSIEHPCIVKNTSKAIDMIGGAQSLSQALDKGTESTLGLTFNPKDPSCRAILSLHNETKNLLLKVTLPKRTGRKRKRGSNEDFLEDGKGRHLKRDASTLLAGLRQNPLAYTVEAVGKISSSHVWRNIPDFVYFTSGSQFLTSIESHILPQHYPSLKQWSIPRTYGLEDTEAIPPSVFSTQSLSHNYTYRQNPAVKTFADPDTGNKRLHNTAAPAKLYVQSCMYDDQPYPSVPIPDCPPLDTQPRQVKVLVGQMRKLFEERPIWTRRALMNNLPLEAQAHFVRHAAAYVAFNLRSGPWRDTYCALGVDPRKDPKHRMYQTLLIKLVPKDGSSLQSRGGRPERLWTRSPDVESHIFTGKKPIPPDGKIWQMCDLQDPTLKQLAEVPELHVRAECETRYFGWYMNGTNAKMRVLLKAKIDASLEDTDLDPEMVKTFLHLPENWNPKARSPGDRPSDPTSGYLPESSNSKELEWASAYRSICRTSTGSIPNYGSTGKGRLSKSKPLARPSFIDPGENEGEEAYENSPTGADRRPDNQDDAEEAQRDAELAAEYEEPEDAFDDDMLDDDEIGDSRLIE